MPDFSNKRNVFLLVIWVLSIVAAAIMLSTGVVHTPGTLINMHIICGTVYGFVIVNSIIFASILANEEIQSITLCVTLAFGAVFYFISTCLMVLSFLSVMDMFSSHIFVVILILVELVLCAALTALYIFLAVAIYATKKL